MQSRFPTEDPAGLGEKTRAGCELQVIQIYLGDLGLLLKMKIGEEMLEWVLLQVTQFWDLRQKELM